MFGLPDSALGVVLAALITSVGMGGMEMVRRVFKQADDRHLERSSEEVSAADDRTKFRAQLVTMVSEQQDQIAALTAQIGDLQSRRTSDFLEAYETITKLQAELGAMAARLESRDRDRDRDEDKGGDGGRRGRGGDNRAGTAGGDGGPVASGG